MILVTISQDPRKPHYKSFMEFYGSNNHFKFSEMLYQTTGSHPRQVSVQWKRARRWYRSHLTWRYHGWLNCTLFKSLSLYRVHTAIGNLQRWQLEVHLCGIFVGPMKSVENCQLLAFGKKCLQRPQKMYKMSMRKPRLVSSFILIIAEVSNSNVPFSIVGFLSLQTSGHDLNNGLKYLQIKLILDEVTWIY